MIELLIILSLTRRIGALIRDKGRKPGIYQFLVVVLWIAGEMLGFLIGVFLDLGAGGYLLALLGAAGGAATAYAIARAAEPVPLPETVGEVFD